MMETRIELAAICESKFLWTRELARKVRAQIAPQIEELQPGDVLVIDAKGVEVFDYSFANEFFGKTILSLPVEHSGSFLIVENLSRYAQENLEKALESLGLLTIERNNGQLRLIGKVHPADIQTFELIYQSIGPITSSAIKDRLGIGINAVNERLSKLAQMGVVRRKTSISLAGRGQYEYTSPK